MLKIYDYAEQHSPYSYAHAKACAKATIECIYHRHKDNEGLDQCLMYIKNLESDKH